MSASLHRERWDAGFTFAVEDAWRPAARSVYDTKLDAVVCTTSAYFWGFVWTDPVNAIRYHLTSGTTRGPSYGMRVLDHEGLGVDN